jgi:hypothetical protein|tara:strand:+ start:98 stop:520 length:423 start_codon:yes stop_codon:yes gene_type:complete
MKEVTLNRYVHKLIAKEKVRDFVGDSSDRELVPPTVMIVPSCGPLIAGQTFGKRLIQISSWILVDGDDTVEAVLRHEVAHAVKVHCKLTGDAHGAEFTRSLKHVAPRTWRRDKYWWPTPVIEEARLKIHTKSKSILNRLR